MTMPCCIGAPPLAAHHAPPCARARTTHARPAHSQIEVLASFIISTILNGLLLVQYFYYNFGSAGKKAPKAVPAPAPAAPPASADEPEPKSSGSISSARRRSKRD